MKKIGKRLILVSSIRILGFFFIFLTSSFCLLSHAAVLTVPGDYATIQAAIDAAADGDEIIVSPGTYYESVSFLGKNIILRSTDPASPTVVSSTIIDGRSTDSVVTFSGTELTTCVLSGFTITNGYAASFGGGGGGIYGNGSRATVKNNIILSNRTSHYGSGGGVSRCNGAIKNNIISGNWADYGGGLVYCNGTIQNNTVYENTSYSSGGGLAWCFGIIQDNTITGNRVLYGAGGGLYSCNGVIQYNTVSNNEAEDGGGLFYCNGAVERNVIRLNSARYRYGGGLAYCGGSIKNNAIMGNSAIYDGGGLYDCDGIIENNSISGNIAQDGGGLFECGGVIQNNTVWGNSARSDGGGLCWCNNTIRHNTIYNNSAGYRGGGLYGCFTAINCIIWGNSASKGAQLDYSHTPSYSCIQDWTDEGTGNISVDPQFVHPDNDDFHLLPSSPCIDAGGYVEYLTEDFEGDARPYNGTAEPRGDGSDFDIGADEFTGVVTLQDFNFDLTEEGWGLVEISHFTPPHFDYSPGQLILTAQDNTNTYGFWTSELDAVPVIADCLYRASWTVATDVTDPLAVPNMLLRVNSQNFQQADMLVVSSAGDGSYAPTPEGRTYEMYFVPPESALGKPEDQDDLILSFDIMNFDAGDAPDGSLMLDRVVVDAIPLDTLITATVLKTWSFETDSEGWEFGSVPIFTAPLSGIGAGALWLIAQDNTNTFGFWSGPSEEVEMEEGKLYRLRFTVITDVMVKENVPHLRLRVSSEDFQSSIVKLISSVTGAETSPTSAGRSYDLYFYPPQSLVGTPENGLLAAFDILNFDPGDSASGALILDGVVVESFDLVP